VGAAAPYVPEPLINQLAIGGSLVIPVGPENQNQYLMLIEKIAEANSPNGYILKETNLCGVRYVPLTTKDHQLRNRS